MKTIKYLATSLTLLASATAFANGDATAKKLPFDAKPIVHMGYSFGGEDMGGLKYDDGSSTDVTAGGGFTFGGGLDLNLNKYELIKDRDVGVRLTANYHFDSATAENADVTFDRFEFNIMPYIAINEKVNVSAGIAFHTGVEFTQEMDGLGKDSIEYAGATALVAEIMFKHSEQLSFAVRATSVDYEIDRLNGTDLSQFELENHSGSNVGAFLVYSFNR